MAEPTAPNSDRFLIAVGVLTAGAGFYFALVGLGMLQPPGRINGPVWLALFIGVVFFATGISVVVRGLTGADDTSGDLPETTPVWMKTVYWLDSVVAMAGLAAIGTWVAFGSGKRGFSIGGPISGPIGEGIGRVVFGIGAIITWFIVLAFARAGARKIFGRKSENASS